MTREEYIMNKEEQMDYAKDLHRRLGVFIKQGILPLPKPFKGYPIDILKEKLKYEY